MRTATTGVFTVSGSEVSGVPIVAGRTITITVTEPIVGTSTITVGYTGTDITDGSGNELVDFTSISVTDNMPGASTITESDSPAISDATSLNIFITHTDTPVISDESDMQITNAPGDNTLAESDSPVISDATSLNISITHTDTPAISDATSLNISITHTDTPVISDESDMQITNAPGDNTLAESDSPVISDATSLNIFITHTDTPAISDESDISDINTPTVVGVSATGGPYKEGGIIEITVTFDQSVTLSGVLHLTLETGDDDAVVVYTSNTPGTELEFQYTVAAGHNSADLNYVDTTPLVLSSGTLVASTGGAAADLSLPAVTSLGGSSAVVVDTAAPTVIISNDVVADNGTSPTDTVSYTVTFNEPVTGFDMDDIAVSGTAFSMLGASNFATVMAGTTYTFDVVTLSDGTVIVSVPENVAADPAGNQNAASNPYTVAVDAAVPAIISARLSTNTITIIYNTPVTTILSDYDDLITTDSSTPTVTSVTGTTTDTILLALSSAVPAGTTATIDIVGPVKTSASGLVLEALVDYLVTAEETVELAGIDNRVIVTDPDSTLATITYPSTVDATLDYSSRIATTAEVSTVTTNEEIVVTATGLRGGDVKVTVPAATVFSSPTFDGILVLPTDSDFDTGCNSAAITSGARASCIEIGQSNSVINTDKPIRIQLGDQAGNVPWYSEDGAAATQITTACAADNFASVSAQLDSGEECFIDVSPDLIIWTTHFTVFGSNSVGVAGPTATISTDDAVNGGTAISDVIFYTVTFSETVTDFVDEDDITLGGTATATVFAPTPAESPADDTTTYNFVVTATSDGTVIVTIPAGAAEDTSNNGNAVSDPYTVTVDIPAQFVSEFGSRGSGDGQFIFPGGVTTNSTHILVTDTDNNRIQIFDLDGNFVSKFGSRGSGDGEFKRPSGITTNSTHILVADTSNDRIQIFDLEGNYESQFGTIGTIDTLRAEGIFDGPLGITTNSTHILVVDSSNHRVQVFDTDGNFESEFGRSAPDIFDRYHGIAMNSTHILVTETNSRVDVFDTSGNYLNTFGSNGTANGQLVRPTGIIMNNDLIYVADLGNDRIQIFDSNGEFVGKFGGTGSGDGQFDIPVELATNSTHILVVDNSNSRIQTFALDTVVPTPQITSPTVSNGGATTSTTITYTVQFGEVVTGFTASDIAVSGTADTTVFAPTTDTHTRYNFAVTAKTDGTVKVSIPAGMVIDGSGNKNTASDTYTATVDTAAPTISSIATADETTIVITASEPLDGTVALNDFTLTSNTFTVVPVIDGSTITITVVRPIVYTDEPTVSYTAGSLTDVAGNALASFGAQTVTNNVPNPNAPTVTGVSATGGSYNVGNIIAITITFDELVYVTDTPQLTLDIGDDNTVVDYSSGTGTTKLVFPYTVGATHNSDDLDYASINSLSLNDGTILAVDNGVAANLVLPAVASAKSLGGSSDVVIDNVAPTVLISAATADGVTTSHRVISYIATFSEDVTDFGDDTTDITLSGTAVATLSASTGSGTTYNFVVTATSDGTVEVTIPAGAAEDEAENANTASDTHTVTVSNLTQIDSVNLPAGGYRHNLIQLSDNYYVSSHTVTIPNDNPDYWTYATTLRLYSIIDGDITPLGSRAIQDADQTKNTQIHELNTHPKSTAITRMDDDTIAISYVSTGSSSNVRTYTVDTDSTTKPFIDDRVIAFRSGTDAGQTHNHSLITLDENRMVLAYSYPNNAPTGFMHVIDIHPDTGVLRVGDPVPITANQGLYPSMIKLDVDTIVVAYRGNSAHPFIQAFDISAEGTVTAKAARDIEIRRTAYNSLVRIDDNTVAVAYSAIGVSSLTSDGHGTIKVFDVDSEGNIDERNSQTYQNTAANAAFEEHIHHNSMVLLDSDTLAVAYRGDDAYGFVLLYDIDHTTDGLTVSGGPFEHDAAYGAFNSLVRVDDDTLALVYGGDLPSVVQDTVTPNIIKTLAAVDLDTTLPVIESAVTVDATTIVLGASEQLAGIVLAGDFVVSDNTVAATVISGSTITITVDTKIQLLNSPPAVSYFGNMIFDTAGNALATFNPRPVINTVPVITAVSAAGGPYHVGDTVDITVTFNESVTVTGMPQLLLETGTDDAVAYSVSDQIGTVITFQYTVAAGENSDDLNYVGTGSLSLNGGTIVATDGGISASLRLPAPTSADSLGGRSDVVVDTATPTVRITAVTSHGNTHNSETVSYTATFSEGVTGFDATDVVITGEARGTVVSSSFVGTNNPTYTFDVRAAADGELTVSIPGDAVDESSSGHTNIASDEHTITIDTTGPSVTVSSDVDDGTGTTLSTTSYTVTFTEDVAGFAASDIMLTGTANGGIFDEPSLTPMGDSVYMFDVEITSDGTVFVSVAEDAAHDLTGNGNAASNTHTITVNIMPLDILSAVWRDPDELDEILSDGDVLTITFNQNTDMAGSPTLSRSELDAVFVFERSLGANYTGAWSDARTLVITIVDSTDADVMIGDTISPFRGTAFIRSVDTTGGTAFDNPVSVGTNSTGHVFVGDDISGHVQIFDPDGVYAGALDTSALVDSDLVTGPLTPEKEEKKEAQIASSRPAGIATNSTGYIFVAYNGDNLVLIFDPDGVHVGALVTRDDLTFREPAGVAVGPDDRIYVSDTDENRDERDRRIVQIFDQDGTYAGVLATTVNTEFDVPLAVATNSSGHVFVADSGNDNIRIFDSNGENTSNIDTTGPTTGSALRAVATNSTDHLFVVYDNAGVDTVQVYTASGVYAGDQSFGDDVNLGIISGIAVGSDDKIIVSERLNDDVHIFGHQVLSSDTGLQQFETAANTDGNFGELRATVSISSVDVADGATTGLGTIHFTAEFSETVTDFTTTDDVMVSGGTITDGPTPATSPADGTTYTFEVDVTDVGTLTVSIPADAALDSDNRGNAASDVYTVTVIDTAPVVTSVSVVNGGAYMAGETIDITVTFDDAVTVDGTPQLTLETGVDDDDDAVVDYSSGTGTTKLVFSYTVGATHNSNDLNYVNTNSLRLNGGTIVALDDGAVANLALPAVDSGESLGGRDVIVDTIAPTLSPTFSSAATTVDSNTVVDIVFSEPLAGNPTRDTFTVSESAVFKSEIVGSKIRLTLVISLVTESHTVSYPVSGSITDMAGNPVAVFNDLPIDNTQFETDPPVPVISSDTVSNGDTTTSHTIVYFVNFGELVNDFTADDIEVSGMADATISDPTRLFEADIVRYTFTATATTGGTLVVSIPENKVTDIYENENIASDPYTVIIDITPTQYRSSVTTNATAITITANRPLCGNCRYGRLYSICQ